MKTFIDFLLEKKEAAREAKTILKEEYSPNPISLEGFRILISAKKNTCKNVVIVSNNKELLTPKKEFKWKEGETKAILQPSGSNSQDCEPQDLINDIEAIKEVAKDLTKITFQLQIEGDSTTEKFGFYEDLASKTLYLGFECDPEKVLDEIKSQGNSQTQAEAPEELQTEEPLAQPPPPPAPTGTAIKFGSTVANIEEYKEEKSSTPGPKINQNTGGNYVVICGKYEIGEFKQTVESSSFKALGQSFIDAILGEADAMPPKKIFYKKIAWTEQGIDSFIKRLKFFAVQRVSPSGGVLLNVMTFGPHPTVIKMNILTTPEYMVNVLFNSSTADGWLKMVLKNYLDAFNKSSSGITVLADPHKFFKTSQKYQIQQDPPFVVGKLVQASINATPPSQHAASGQSGTGNQDTQTTQAAAPAVPKPKGVSAAIAAAHEKFKQSLSSKGIGGITAGIGTGGTGLKYSALRMLPAGQTFMSFRFPGVDSTQLFDQEAIEFLKQYNLWDGKFGTMYEEAKATIPELKLAISFDGRLGQ